MKKIHWLGLGLIFLCFSCASTGSVRNKQPQPSAEEPEATDRSCAYFYFLWGKAAEHAERYEEALHAFEKVLVCDPETGSATREIAILLIKMDRHQEAAQWLEKIVADNPTDIENRLLLAKLYTSMGDFDKAATIYKELLAIKEDSQTLLMLGSIYAQQREFDKARELLERMIKLNPDSYLGHYYLARIYREMGSYKEALVFYEKTLAIAWSTRLASEVAELYEQQGNFTQAIKLYQRILEEDENDERARTRLVALFLKTEEPDRAIQELRKLRVFATHPDQVDYTICRILLANERYKEATDILVHLLEKNANRTDARYLLALAYRQQGLLDKAKEQAGLIPPSAEEYEESIQLWVRVLQDEKHVDEAVQLLEERIAREETRKMSFYVILASLYRDQDQVDKAKQLYQEALEIYPDNAELLFEYGIFQERIGEQDRALATMQEVLRIEPDNAAALNYIGYTWADRDVNLQQALEYIERAVALRPEDGFIRDSLGWVYFKLGKIDQAIVELEKALELVTDDAIIYEHMGDIYRRAGEIGKARTAYEKALEHQEEAEKKAAVRRKIETLESGEK